MKPFPLVRSFKILHARKLIVDVPNQFFFFVVDEDCDHISPVDTLEVRFNGVFDVFKVFPMVDLAVLAIDVVHLVALAKPTCLVLALSEHSNGYHAQLCFFYLDLEVPNVFFAYSLFAIGNDLLVCCLSNPMSIISRFFVVPFEVFALIELQRKLVAIFHEKSEAFLWSLQLTQIDIRDQILQFRDIHLLRLKLLLHSSDSLFEMHCLLPPLDISGLQFLNTVSDEFEFGAFGEREVDVSYNESDQERQHHFNRVIFFFLKISLQFECLSLDVCYLLRDTDPLLLPFGISTPGQFAWSIHGPFVRSGLALHTFPALHLIIIVRVYMEYV